MRKYLQEAARWNDGTHRLPEANFLDVHLVTAL